MSGTGAQVLLIDDDPDMQHVVKFILEAVDCRSAFGAASVGR